MADGERADATLGVGEAVDTVDTVAVVRTRAFQAERVRLAAVATRILGGTTETDDVLQEAWLRLDRATEAGTDIDDLPAWLTTVVTRLCLDHLRRQRVRRSAETSGDLTAGAGQRSGGSRPGGQGSVGSEAGAQECDGPEAEALLAGRVGEAMQVVLDTLAPAERAAFVLHDVFGYPFEDVGAVLGRSVAAARQLASRGRRKVRGAPEPAGERSARRQHAEVVEAFLIAAHGGDLTTLLDLLAPDVVMRADGVGVRTGAQAVYSGADAVAGRFSGAKGALAAEVGGELGGAWFMAKEVKVAFAFRVEAGRVAEIELIADPEVLSILEVTRRPPPRRRRRERNGERDVSAPD